MQVAEVFESIQGEGPWAGTKSLFIRTSGCNLRCSFCDTPYTSWSPEGTAWSLDQLVQRVQQSDAPDVVLTGGEPLLVPEIAKLAAACRQQQKRVTIETAGTVASNDVECDMLAISPKLANSTPDHPHWKIRHEQARFRPDIVQKLISRNPSILKFVVEHQDDIDEVLLWLAEVPSIQRSMVWLMPQAKTRKQLHEKSELVREIARLHNFNFSSRLHVEMYDDLRGI
ncbi:MAG: 7-carboxy-7-deazaguanine synthase QueE [Planctomycetaceae bacterium]|jgi:7-carboxy-7-deazaguanine synthase